MNTTPKQPETPLEEEARLTAFVLGELDEAEAASFARRMEQDDSLRREVEAIRRTVEVVAADLQRETVPGLTPEQHAAIERGPASAHPPRSILYSFATMRNLWAGVGLAAAACLAVVLWPSVSIGPEEASVAFESPELRANAASERLGRDRAAGEAVGGVDKRRSDASLADDVSDAPRADASGIAIRVEELRSREEQAAGLQSRRGGDTLASKKIDAPGRGGLEAKQEGNAGLADRRQDGGRSGGTAAPAPARAAEKRAVAGGGGGFGLAPAAAPPAESKGAEIGGTLAESETPAGAAPTDEADRDRAAGFGEPAFRQTLRQPRATFPLDVPTEAYDAVRVTLRAGRLPAKDAVRIEEMVNAFDYDYAPATGDDALALDVELGACPWEEEHRLVRIGLRARNATGDDERATVAEAVDVTVAFNPQRVESYRLIGYANPEMTPRPFADEHGLAGAFPAGRKVTVMYEIVPGDAGDGDPEAEMLSIRLRYQEPADGSSRGLERAVFDANVVLEDASDDYRFAAAVAWFGLVLRDGLPDGGDTFRAVLAPARPAPRRDPGFADVGGGMSPERDEFMDLVDRARRLNSRLLRDAAREEAADPDR